MLLSECHWGRRAREPANEDESDTDHSEDSVEAPASQKDEPTRQASATSDTDAPQPSALGESGPTPTRAEKATIREEDESHEPCEGASIPALVASLAQATCELHRAPGVSAAPVSAQTVAVTLTSESPTVAPGASVNVRLQLRNRTSSPLPLDFAVDPDPRFSFQLYTSKGARVDKPPGPEPRLPAEVASADPIEPKTARVTLAPHGTAIGILPWRAVKYRWASKERAKGALPGHGYPREEAGPLGRGKYVVVVVIPWAHVEEGRGRELSHPRTPIEVVGSAQAEPVRTTPSKSDQRATATMPSSPANVDAAVEAQFLKVLGRSSPDAGGAPVPASKKR